MVFFTCNACGASLKKNQVEKHYQNECPTCEVLSCMDCGQDFYGDAYANHTKCISEAEKYQGALYKESGKGGAGKGERKQQEWLEQVKQSVSGAKVSPRVAGLLERIADYPNIPRKKTKFENFVRNSFNVRDQSTLSQLWDAFSGATKKSPASADHSKTVADASEALAKELANTDGVDTEAIPKKKKKKHKETAEPPDTSDTGDAVITNGDMGVEDIGNGEVPKRKKKKRVTVPSADETDAVSIANGIEVEGHHSPVAKKAKKKKKQRGLGEEGADLPDSAAATIEGGGGDVEGVQVAKKVKKKKRKHKESGSSDESGGMLGKKRKHEAAELDSGDVDADGGVVTAKKHKRGGELETGVGTCSEHGVQQLSDGTSQTVVKKHKKKHKHKIEQPLS